MNSLQKYKHSFEVNARKGNFETFKLKFVHNLRFGPRLKRQPCVAKINFFLGF